MQITIFLHKHMLLLLSLPVIFQLYHRNLGQVREYYTKDIQCPDSPELGMSSILSVQSTKIQPMNREIYFS